MKKLTLILICVLLSTLAFAHGGMEHVMGTVSAVTDHSLTVKTTAGDSKTVVFDASTHFLKGEAAATVKDLHVGDRVVIHAHKRDNSLHAAEVKIGASAKPQPH